jgi:hypothetical protein
MVILKTERLIANRDSLSTEAFARESATIAAEQRQVRAEFVFMMGGELAEELASDVTGISQLHEEAEAEAGDDILAGRLANRGRIELVRAIRAMSDANAALVAARPDSALRDERLALDHLQRAFSRTRYILRALTERERLDLSRRLTGTLTDATRDVRPVAESPSDPRLGALRGALANIAALSGLGGGGQAPSSHVSSIAQSVLRVDPGSERLQLVASTLTDAGTAMGRGEIDAARRLLDRAAIDLAAVVRGELMASPSGVQSLRSGRLDGALSDALRRGGGPR